MNSDWSGIVRTHPYQFEIALLLLNYRFKKCLVAKFITIILDVVGENGSIAPLAPTPVQYAFNVQV